jgi:vitamin B12 transporter
MKTTKLKGAAMLLLLFLYAKASFSQENTRYELNEVVISTNRIKSKLDENFKSVEIISSEEIASLPAQSIEEVLSYVTGIDVRQRGGFGVQADISVRGGNFEQTLILLNGVKISDPQTAHHQMNLPIPIDEVERIEILKGPGARIYGQNAFAGAINIITKITKEKRILLNASVGEHFFSKAGGSLSFPLKNIQQSICYNHLASDGYRLNTDFQSHQVFYQAEFKNKLKLYVGHQNKKFGANGFYSNLFPWQWEHTKTTFANLSWQGGKKVVFEPKIYYRNNQDEFLLKRDTPAFYQNQHTTQVIGSDLNLSFSSKLGKTAIGADFRYESILSTNLGEHQRISSGLYIEQKIIFKKFVFSPGVYLSFRPDHAFATFPGIDIGYQFNTQNDLYFSVGRSFRMPSFTELYYNSPANIGNENLEAETALSYEVGYKIHKPTLDVSLALFKRDAEQLIDWIRENETQAWQVVNITDIHTMGLETKLILKTDKIFHEKLFIKSIDFSYSYLQANQQTHEQNYLSKSVLDYLNHQFIAGFSYHILPGLKQIWKIRYEDRVAYPSHILIDSRISYRIKQIHIYLEASNIGGVTYYEFGGMEMPGRWLRIGANLKLVAKKIPTQ